jgi:hypothetical protein
MQNLVYAPLLNAVAAQKVTLRFNVTLSFNY